MLPLTTITKDKIYKVLRILYAIVIMVTLVFLMCYYIPKVYYNRGYVDGVAKGSNTSSTPSTNPTISTELEVTPKEDNNAPDLILNNHYSAVINGKTLEVPIVNKNIKESLETPPNSAAGTITATTTKVEQTLDLTPLLKDYEPKKAWEVGIGVGCLGNKVYVPIDIQRNFSYNKALEFQLNVRDKKIDGVQASYKIRF